MVAHPGSLAAATTWIHEAEAQHQQILVAFYHSEYTPTRMPTVAQYEHWVKKFIKLFPHVHQYEPWNEANRGFVDYDGRVLRQARTPSRPRPTTSTLKRVCPGCNIPALDLLDQPDVAPSLEYLAQFKAWLRRWHVATPTIWGLHDYSDTNRFSSSRTRAILAAVPGRCG